MPNFKPKAKKKINIKNKETIDTLHEKKLIFFHKIEKIEIPNIKKTITELTTELEGEQNIDKIIKIKDQLYDLNKQLNKLEKSKKEYFIQNSKHIFKYFEKKKI